jgi:hypothetical protein
MRATQSASWLIFADEPAERFDGEEMHMPASRETIGRKPRIQLPEFTSNRTLGDNDVSHPDLVPAN